MKKISILGSTGSIGRQCLDVVRLLPEQFEVSAIAAGSNVALAAEQAIEFHPKIVSVATEQGARELCERLNGSRAASGPSSAWPSPEILFGREGMERVATYPEADIVLSAAVGVVGLPATFSAVQEGKTIALANKEVMVAAGEIVMAEARRLGVDVLPVDSEHNAIHQCLRGGERGEVKRLVLTASGGPFRKTPLKQLANAFPSKLWRIQIGRWASESALIPLR